VDREHLALLPHRDLLDRPSNRGIRTTLELYGHLMPGSEAEAASLLEAYLQRKRKDMSAGELGTPRRANKSRS
jgi:hypothetical protein